MDTTTHLSDYIAILRRRKRQVLKTAAIVFLLSVILAIVLPPVYRSTATLLIEQQEVPADLVPSTVTGYVNQRIQIIKNRVLTSENLMQVAERLDLYPKQRDEKKDSKVIGKIRNNIKIETVSANVTDPRSGASSMATIAFKLSYSANTPEVAQKVAEELASLFVNENRAVRTQKAERASGFLGEEEERLREYIDDLESKLTGYKEKNTGQLPELMNMNMQLLERTQRELEESERQIYSLDERAIQLESQLALIEPYTGSSPGGRLREVQGQYLIASAAYSPDHPDVIRLRRELDTLKKQTGISDERAAVEGQYKKLKGELAAAREKYADDHPDIVQLKKSLGAVEQQMKSAGPAATGFSVRPDNPAYVTLQSQLDAVKLNLKAAKEQRARSRERLAEYEKRITHTPRVEQEGLALQREYDNATKKYREIKQNLMGAELAVELERDQRGERYSIMEPPELPESPEMPNRRAFLLLGLVLGLGSGVGYASIAEYMDRTVRGPRVIAAVLQAPPLAVIPYIPNGIDPGFQRA